MKLLVVRCAPVAIQRPSAPAGLTIRIRNSGLSQLEGMFAIVPAYSASPRLLRLTGGESSAASSASPTLHTSVPSTCVTGPGVPLKAVPLITSPSTENDVAPVERFTRARPCSTDQA